MVVLAVDGRLIEVVAGVNEEVDRVREAAVKDGTKQAMFVFDLSSFSVTAFRIVKLCYDGLEVCMYEIGRAHV